MNCLVKILSNKLHWFRSQISKINKTVVKHSFSNTLGYDSSCSKQNHDIDLLPMTKTHDNFRGHALTSTVLALSYQFRSLWARLWQNTRFHRFLTSLNFYLYLMLLLLWCFFLLSPEVCLKMPVRRIFSKGHPVSDSYDTAKKNYGPLVSQLSFLDI